MVKNINENSTISLKSRNCQVKLGEEFCVRCGAYLLFDEFREGVAGNNLLVFGVLADFDDQDGQDFALHFDVVPEDANRVQKHIPILIRVSFVQ